MELVFIHGWGCDAHFWDALAPLLPGYQQQRLDMGFFGPSSDVQFHSGGRRVLIGHSLGFLHGWNLRQDWDAWIAINSFPRFVKSNTQPGCVPAAVLKAMRLGLAVAPKKTMHDFYKMLVAHAPRGSPDIDRLREGLDELRDSDIDQFPQASKIPGMVLASRRDHWIPTSTSTALGEIAQDIAWRETNGHVLPHSDPAWCVKEIQNFLEKLSF